MSVIPTVRGAMVRAVGRAAPATAIEVLSPRVWRVRLAGPSLRGLNTAPGDKIKLHVGGGQMRSYTPSRVDDEAGELEMLVHVHGESAASTWARELAVGDEVSFMGPARSVDGGARDAAWLCFFGDETAIGLAERLFDAAAPSLPKLGAIEAEQGDLPAVEHLPLSGVARGAEHGDALVEWLEQATLPPGKGRVWLSGEGGAVVRLRAALLARGLEREQLCIKPYWSVRGKKHRKQLERTVLAR